MGELEKSGRWEKKCQGAKNGRNSKLREGSGRLGEIKVGDSDPPPGASTIPLQKLRII